MTGHGWCGGFGRSTGQPGQSLSLGVHQRGMMPGVIEVPDADRGDVSMTPEESELWDQLPMAHMQIGEPEE